MVCKKLGLSIKTVSEAASLDESIGKYGVNGGRPFEGACFPKDLDAFITFVSEKGINPQILRAVKKVNEEIAEAVEMATE